MITDPAPPDVVPPLIPRSEIPVDPRLARLCPSEPRFEDLVEAIHEVFDVTWDVARRVALAVWNRQRRFSYVALSVNGLVSKVEREALVNSFVSNLGLHLAKMTRDRLRPNICFVSYDNSARRLTVAYGG